MKLGSETVEFEIPPDPEGLSRTLRVADVMRKRGLDFVSKPGELVESEFETGSLSAAASKVFAASQQRCRVHWMRNALAHAAPKQRPAVIAIIKTIFAQETAEAAHQQWEQVASTNPLGRVNKEIKRRADVIGIFPNDAAVIRLLGALMLEQNDEWAVLRRYKTLETLGSVSHNPIVSLPALTA